MTSAAATGEGLGLADRILPARGAAQRASASIAGQLNDSPTNPFREPAPRTKSVKYRYTATGKHLSSPLKGSASSPERKKPKLPSSHAHKGKSEPSPVAPSATSRKRKASAAVRTDDISAIFSSSPSPLSSVPSPIVATKDLPTSPPPPDPPRSVLVSKSLSFHTFGPPVNVPLSSKRKQKKPKKSAHRGTDNWVIGNSVWVLVNPSGALADNTAPEPLMWWPAQVVQTHPLRVSLFGDFPSSSSTIRGLRTIFSPSSTNIQSVNDDGGTQRFTRTTFRLSTKPDDDAAPPTKKPRLDDIEARWESAVESMDKASTLEMEGLPALLSSYATPGRKFYDSLDDSDPDVADLHQPLGKPPNTVSKPTASTKKLKSQRSRASLGHDPQEFSPPPRQWSPCPPDPTLQIPGELILAMAPKTGGSYWPAQILAHVPDRKEKYRVKFLDEEVHVVTRDKFWTSEEEGFVQCTLGEWESAIKTIEDPESGDEDEEDADVQDVDESALPPPPPPGDFEDLPVRAQVAHVKPVLRAILNKEYPPAKAKHEAFMKGGSARAALLKSAGVRGGMDARYIRAVQKAISKWVLGDSRVRPERLDIGDIATGTNATGEAEETAANVEVSREVVPAETLPRESTEDNKMEGIIDAVDATDGTSNGDLPLISPDKQIDVGGPEMVVDAVLASLPPPSNSVTLSPTVKQAAPKSQLDLLAEVSQAVATEPSLLPSHPDLPKLRVDVLNIPPQDMSPLPSPLTSIADDEPPPFSTSVLVLCEEFEMLSRIEKLDYCLNVLLPECIQQLLLWRSGQRTSVALLSPEEEQRLHDVGARKAAETDWVEDVMRLRAAQARLWGVDLNKKAGDKTEAIHGGTRSRPQRGTVSRP